MQHQQNMYHTIKKFLFIAIMLALAASIILAKHPFEIYHDKPMPALELSSLEGEKFTLRKWQGPIIVNFFASWCSNCIQELPQLAQLAKQLPVYGIAWQDNKQQLEKWIAQHNPAFTEVALANDWQLLWDLRLNGVPTTLILDSEQRIIYTHEGIISPEDITKLNDIINNIEQ